MPAIDDNDRPRAAAALHLGDLHRRQPVDPSFGAGRGRPIDRHYIERFLGQHAADVRGTVLEVAEDRYTRRFGGPRVGAAEVLHREPGHPRTDFVADLADGRGLPGERFSCFICTQTLQYVFDLAAAVSTVHRILQPGGVWLLTVPGISQISPYDRERWGEHWRFTPQSAERLLRSHFDDVQVRGHGNVLAAVGFLCGLACEDLGTDDLDHEDDRYPVIVTARAVKQPAAPEAA